MEYGHPRNDILLRQPGKHDLVNVDTECYAAIRQHRKKGGKVVVYMPTFRDNFMDFIDAQGNIVLNPGGLAAFAEKHNTLFLLKLHPYVNDAKLSARHCPLPQPPGYLPPAAPGGRAHYRLLLRIF